MPVKQRFSQKGGWRQKRAVRKLQRAAKPKRTGFLFWRRARLEPPRTERFEKFTERSRKVFSLAQEEAQRFNHNYIGTEHLLLGLIRESDGIAARVLANLGVQLPKVRSAVKFIIGRGDGIIVGDPGLTPRAAKVIKLAMDEAQRIGSPYIGTEHLLLGLVREGEGIAAGVMQSMGVSLEKVRQQVMQIVTAASSYPSPQATSRDISPTTMSPWSGTSDTSSRGAFASVNANELVYGLTFSPETFTKLAAVAQQLQRPVGDFIREAIARTWLVELPANSALPHEQVAATEEPPHTEGETPDTPSLAQPLV